MVSFKAFTKVPFMQVSKNLQLKLMVVLKNMEHNDTPKHILHLTELLREMTKCSLIGNSLSTVIFFQTAEDP